MHVTIFYLIKKPLKRYKKIIEKYLNKNYMNRKTLFYFEKIQLSHYCWTNMSSTKKTILFVTINAWGHINAWIGIAQELLSRGHRVVWALDRSFEGKLSCLGFEEVLVGKVDKSNDDKEFWQKFMFERCKYLKEDRLTILREYTVPTFQVFVSDTIEQDSEYREVVEKVKPDVLVMDRYIACIPLNYSGIPFVVLYSSAPHCLLRRK